MSSPPALAKRRRALVLARQHLADARMHMEDAAGELHGVRLALDLDYAFADADWQEGPGGAQNTATCGELRQAVETLRGIALPDVQEVDWERLK